MRPVKDSTSQNAKLNMSDIVTANFVTSFVVFLFAIGLCNVIFVSSEEVEGKPCFAVSAMFSLH